MTPRRRCALISAVVAVLASVAIFLAPAQAFWSSTSAANGTGAGKATTVGTGATPTVTVSGATIVVSWAASTTVSGAAVTGYDLVRYDAGSAAPTDPQNGCSGTVSGTTCTESDVPEGSWRYTVTPMVGVNWSGAESAMSASVLVDVTAPTSSLSLSNVNGKVSLTGSTVFYNGTSAGSFTLTNTVSDSGSGPASSATATLGGTATGWTHNASTVTTPNGGPYVSATFSWLAGSTSNPTETVTATDAAGNAAQTTLRFTEDSTAPSGTITYADGFSSGRSVSVAYTTSANGSPVSTAQLQRSRASLKNGVCGTFGAFSDLGPANPTSPYLDGPFAAGGCYQYQLVVTDTAGNTAPVMSTTPAIARIGYAGAVQATSGVLSYLRLGENAATATDSFTGTAGVALQERNGELGATWTRHPASKTDAVLTAAGRLRKDGTTASALYSSSGVPLSADYRVTADLYMASQLASDRIGVVGRLDPTVATYYVAAYDRATGAYTLSSVVNGGTATTLGTATAAFSAGETHKITLDMVGSTIRVLVDGVQVITVSDTSVTAIGRGGVLLGSATNVTDQDTNGLQLDNYVVGPVLATPKAADSKGANAGTYLGGVTLGSTGVLAGDPDTAASFDGTDDYVQVASPSGLPTGSSARTVETWFKTSSTNRVVLFNYGSPATNAEFGLWLNAGGKGFTSWAGGAGTNATWTLGTAVNNNAWHQAVLVYSGTALSLYVDGSLVSSPVTATRSTTLDSTGFVVGAVLAANQTGATGGYFAGLLDEVSVYSAAVPAATIADHYALANPYQDVDGPTGGSVDGTNLSGVDGRYRTTTSVVLSLAKGIDPSGLAASGAQLQTLKATLSGNTCATFTVAATVIDPAASYTATVASGSCYRYRYVVADTLGNTTSYISPNIKVDTTAPAASALSSTTTGTNAYRNATTVYYRSAASSGTITLTGRGSDTTSSIASYAWPTLGTGWSTSTANSQLITNNTVTYAWSAPAPSSPGTVGFNDANYAGLASTTASSFSFVDDVTAPTGGAISYADGKTTATSVTVSYAAGSDSQSGVLQKYQTLQQAVAPAAGGTCGTFAAWTNLSSTLQPTTMASTVSLAQDTCYRFQYVVKDNVGNSTTYTSSSVVRRTAAYNGTVSGNTSLVDYWRLDEASGASMATDAKGGDNPGTYVGGPTLGTTGAIVADADTAATFDGSSQYVGATRNLSGALSLELWVNTTSTTGGTSTSWSGNAALLDADVAGNAADYGISMNSAGAVTAGTGVSTGADTTLTSQSGLNDGQWHLVVLTRSAAGAMVLYVDGAQAATATGSSAALTASTTLNMARAASGGRFFAGSLDEVATYNAVLAASVVAAHYNAGK